MSNIGRPTKLLTEQQIRIAMKHTGSNRAAARFLNVSFPTYKMYARQYLDQATGKSLYDVHLNRRGKGIPKWRAQEGKDPLLKDLLKPGMSLESYSVDKLKTRLIYEGILAPECNKCGYNEPRVLDYKVPVILSFKDGNKHNWTLENLEFLCYNCYHNYVGDLFTPKQIRFLEDAGAPTVKTNQTDWQLDDYYKEHFYKLGIMDREENTGEDFIDQI